MKPLFLFSSILILIPALLGCTRISSSIPSATVTYIPALIETPTGIVKLPTNTLSLTPTPVDTLEPIQAIGTIEPLLREPMNCDVPCFWGIIPGKTTLDETRIFFERLGFIPFEGRDHNIPTSGMYFYSIEYNTGRDYPSNVTLYSSENIIQNILITPHIRTPKEDSPEWIAFSPDTLIKRYGSPSRISFTVGLGPNIGINMIMYFDMSDLVVHYSGYNMNPKQFCPLTAPFDFTRIWIGHNPPHTPSFETVPLEKATSLNIEKFTQLIIGDPNKACFEVNGKVSP